MLLVLFSTKQFFITSLTLPFRAVPNLTSSKNDKYEKYFQPFFKSIKAAV